MWRLIEFHFTESAKQLKIQEIQHTAANFSYAHNNDSISCFNTCQIGRDEEFSLVYILDRGLGRFFHNNLQKEKK